MSEFDKLDEKIDTVIDRLRKAKSERELIKKSLKSKDTEVRDIKDNLKTLEGEKKQTKGRLDGLLRKINVLIENNG